MLLAIASKRQQQLPTRLSSCSLETFWTKAHAIYIYICYT